MAQTQTKVTNLPKTYSFKQREQLWLDAGGSKSLAPIMAAISMAENTAGDPRATHHNNNGTVDRGLWQINSVHGYGQSSFDPRQNARQAVSVYNSEGLNAWSTFRSGTYKKYLPKQSATAFAGKQGLGLMKDIFGGDVAGVAGDVTGVHQKTITNAASGVESAVLLGLKEAMYGLAIFGGAMLILLGLLFIGVDVGIAGLSSRAQAHPVYRLGNRVASRVKPTPSTQPPVSEGGNLPGPE